MFRGFFWKIWALGIFCSAFAICLVLFGLVNYYLKGEEEEMLRRNYLLGQVITHEVESGYLKGMWPYKTLKMVSDDEDVLFLWITKPDGEIFWANEPEMMGKIIEDPFLGSEEVKNRNSYFRGEKIKLIAHPMKIELKEKPWTLFLGVSFKQLRMAQREIIFLSIGLLVMIVIFIGFISYYFSKRITAPLKLLAKDLGIIGKGNLRHRVKIRTGDEIEEVGGAVNKMTEELEATHFAIEESKKTLEIKVRARTQELREFAADLEEKVKERTKELQERIDELERFHRLTVGRELRMLELKKSLRETQEKIAGLGKKQGKNAKVKGRQNQEIVKQTK